MKFANSNLSNGAMKRYGLMSIQMPSPTCGGASHEGNLGENVNLLATTVAAVSECCNNAGNIKRVLGR